MKILSGKETDLQALLQEIREAQGDEPLKELMVVIEFEQRTFESRPFFPYFVEGLTKQLDLRGRVWEELGDLEMRVKVQLQGAASHIESWIKEVIKHAI
jgi:hypothetical protein